MKKFFALLLALTMALTFAACTPAEQSDGAGTQTGTQAPVYADLTVADALEAASQKLLAAEAFAMTADSTVAYDSVGNESDQVTISLLTKKNDQGGYDALAEASDGTGIYFCGNVCYWKGASGCETETSESVFTLADVLAPFLEDFPFFPFHEKTLEYFAELNPARTNNSDGSVTYIAENMSFVEYYWVVLGMEMTEDEASAYVNDGISLRFDINSDGYLCGCQLEFGWHSLEQDQASTMTFVCTVAQINEDIKIQAPEWTE